MNEAKLKYRELKTVIDDPLLVSPPDGVYGFFLFQTFSFILTFFQSNQENKELRRRIYVNVISICEKLFNHYIQKAEGIHILGHGAFAVNSNDTIDTTCRYIKKNQLKSSLFSLFCFDHRKISGDFLLICISAKH